MEQIKKLEQKPDKKYRLRKNEDVDPDEIPF
jgi:hypothetical protein